MVESPHWVDAYTIIDHNLLAFEGKIGCPVPGNLLIRLRLNGKTPIFHGFFCSNVILTVFGGGKGGRNGH